MKTNPTPPDDLPARLAQAYRILGIDVTQQPDAASTAESAPVLKTHPITAPHSAAAGAPGNRS